MDETLLPIQAKPKAAIKRHPNKLKTGKQKYTIKLERNKRKEKQRKVKIPFV